MGVVYTELASGLPLIFSHFVTNLPAIHSVVVFVWVKYLPVYTVPEEERFLVKRIGPKNFHMFRCLARCGYRDLRKKDDNFEKKLFESLFLFVSLESMIEGFSDSEDNSVYGHQSGDVGLISTVDSIVKVRSPGQNNRVGSSQMSGGDELEFMNGCRDAGVVHILGNTVIRASRESGICKKIAIGHVYAFLMNVCRV